MTRAMSVADLGDGADWSAVWAASGAATLSGRGDGPALNVPVGVVELASRLAARIGDVSQACGRRVDLDGPALLGERAALTGFSRNGGVSCGGATRLLAAADAWFALSLARADDVSAVPAWLEAPMPDDGADEIWQAIGVIVGTRPVGELVERAVLLGMPLGRLGEVRPSLDASTAVCRRIVGEPVTKPMTDLVVVDLSSLWAGPLCANVLGLAGARVITVESVSRPDGARAGSPAFFDLLRSGNESVCLDFRDVADVARLGRLLERADIVIESSRARALRQLGLDRDHVQGPRVWLSITAHGRNGRDTDRIGFGDDAAVAGGLATRDADGPCFCVDAVADPLTGLAAAAAVLERCAGGGRWHVDVALSRTASVAATNDRTDVAGRSLAPPRARTVLQSAPLRGTHTDTVMAEFA